MSVIFIMQTVEKKIQQHAFDCWTRASKCAVILRGMRGPALWGSRAGSPGEGARVSCSSDLDLGFQERWPCVRTFTGTVLSDCILVGKDEIQHFPKPPTRRRTQG